MPVPPNPATPPAPVPGVSFDQVAERVTALKSVVTASKAEAEAAQAQAKRLRAALGGVTEILKQVGTLQSAPAPADPAPAPAVPTPAPAVAEGPTPAELLAKIDALGATIASQREEIQKMGRLPHGDGRSASDDPGTPPAGSDTHWPMDLNSNVERDQVAPGTSFYERG